MLDEDQIDRRLTDQIRLALVDGRIEMARAMFPDRFAPEEVDLDAVEPGTGVVVEQQVAREDALDLLRRLSKGTLTEKDILGEEVDT